MHRWLAVGVLLLVWLFCGAIATTTQPIHHNDHENKHVQSSRQQPSSFGTRFQVSYSLELGYGDGSKQHGSVSLRWSAAQNAWRTDVVWGDDAQTQTTTVVTYSSAWGYMWSANNSICTTFCLPFSAGVALPFLRIQPTDQHGTTTYSGNVNGYDVWTRVQKSGVALNSTVTYQVDADDYDTPVLVKTEASYSVPGSQKVVATLKCEADLATYKEDDGPSDPTEFR